MQQCFYLSAVQPVTKEEDRMTDSDDNYDFETDLL